MKRKISFGASLAVSFMAVILTFVLTFLFVDAKYAVLFKTIKRIPSDNPKLSEVMAHVETLFVKDIDRELLSDATIYGYVRGLNDQFSTYYTKEQYAEVSSSLQGNMTGIGIRVFLNGDSSEMTIYEVMAGSPAEKAGLLKGDVIDSVNGKSYSLLQYEGAYNELVGAEGAKVEVTVKRGDNIEKFNITRQKFEQQTVSYNISETDSTVGYIKIHSFDNKTTAQFKNAVETLLEKGAKSLIFDVRNNPGGTLDSIVPILDYILPEGPIIRTISKYNTSEEESDAAELSVPMVVLANASSASAAELFTSALMDYDKATFIGEKTFGKGTMQTNIPLTDGSVLHLTTHYYLPPKSDSFDGKGIVPDIEVKLSEESEKNFFMLSETEDEQLAAALDYLKR